MISASEFFYTPGDNLELPDDNEIESGSIDSLKAPAIYYSYSLSAGPDRYGQNERARHATIFTPHKRHLTTKKAVQNLISFVKQPRPHTYRFGLVGHGSPGLLEAGSGDSRFGSDTDITLGTFPVWEPIFKGLAARENFKLTQIVLFGCSTGAESDGARLLWVLATTMGGNVKAVARSGDVLITRTGTPAIISYEIGSVWQIAVGGTDKPPKPIKRPRHAKVENFDFWRELDQLNQDLSLDLKAATAIEISRFSLGSDEEYLVPKEETSAFVSGLFKSPLFVIPGLPLSRVTAEVTIHFGESDSLVIEVFGDRIGFISNREVAFFIDSGLIDRFTLIVQ